MAIETLDDINQILGQCCCELPACPLPVQECESLYGSVDLAYHIYNTPLDIYYQTHNTEYADGGYRRRTFSQAWNTTYFGGIPAVTATEIILDAEPKTGAATQNYLDPIDEDAAAAAGYASLMTTVAWDDGALTYQDECTATMERFDPIDTSDTVLTGRWVRFRWVIPDTWAGSYFKISWDVVFFPETGDPSAVLTDQTWEWTGPGDPEDAATWKSGWYEIAPPESAGETRVVNVRFECYRPTAFGIKPQITGEAVDLPDP